MSLLSSYKVTKLVHIFSSLVLISLFISFHSSQTEQINFIKELTVSEIRLSKLTHHLSANYRDVIDALTHEKFKAEDGFAAIERLQNHYKRKNLRLKGVKADENVTAGDRFRQFCEEFLGVSLKYDDFDTIQFAGAPLSDGSRTILASFVSIRLKNYVLAKAKIRLRNSKYLIFEDLYKEKDPYSLSSATAHQGNNKCNKILVSISEPRTVKRSGMPFGAWMKDTDPSVSEIKQDKIYFLDHFYRNRIVKEFNTEEDFTKEESSDEYTIPNQWAGTGHVIHNRVLYYSKYNSDLLIKYREFLKAQHFNFIIQ